MEVVDALGRRKSSIARIYMSEGKGQIVVNNRDIKEYFTIESVEGKLNPDTFHNFGMYIDGKWYHLKAKEGTFPADDPYYSLDVSVLQENLLDPILGIKNPKEDERIDFVGGIR